MGNIVAIKGIGGYHLACDARNSNAVATLRARKHRQRNRWRSCCQWLTVYQTLRASCLPRPPRRLCWWIKNMYLSFVMISLTLTKSGVMLPANPLQHLLLQELQCPLVMTSGNLSGKPPAISNEQALADLQGIADGFLIHNRDIVQRMDDSVVRESGECCAVRGVCAGCAGFARALKCSACAVSRRGSRKIPSARCAANKRC